MPINFYKRYINYKIQNEINGVDTSFNFYILQINLNFIALLNNLLVKYICDM